MRRKHWTAGWTRIPEPAFKAAIAQASKTETDLCARLRLAIKATAARGGVTREVRDQYLRWITEVEAALAVMAKAEKGLSSGIAPVALPQTTATAG